MGSGSIQPTNQTVVVVVGRGRSLARHSFQPSSINCSPFRLVLSLFFSRMSNQTSVSFPCLVIRVCCGILAGKRWDCFLSQGRFNRLPTYLQIPQPCNTTLYYAESRPSFLISFRLLTRGKLGRFILSAHVLPSVPQYGVQNRLYREQWGN